MDNQNPKQLMEDGWKAREELRFDEAEILLNQAKQIFETNKDWFNVTECLNHLAYTKKLRSQQLLNEGISLIEDAHSISDREQTKDMLIMRARISLLEVSGNFEGAKFWATKILAATEKANLKADILSHLSTFTLRTGNISKSKELLDQSDKYLQESWDTEVEPMRSIWKCRNMFQRVLIYINSGELEDAKKLAKEVIKYATEKVLKTRIKQAQQLLDLCNLLSKSD